jgi:hypothetical protein
MKSIVQVKAKLMQIDWTKVMHARMAMAAAVAGMLAVKGVANQETHGTSQEIWKVRLSPRRDTMIGKSSV